MRCAHHPGCPGCPQLERSDSAQLVTKAGRLRRALARYPHVVADLDLDGLRVRPATRVEGYRHRLKLPVERSPRRSEE